MKLFRKGFWPKALVAILVLLQFAAVLVLFLYLLNLTQDTVWAVVVIFIIFCVSVGFEVHVLASNIPNAFKISWMWVIGCLPLFGIFLYLLFGNKQTSWENQKGMYRYAKPIVKSDTLGTTTEQFNRFLQSYLPLSTYLQTNAGAALHQQTIVNYYSLGDLVLEPILKDLETAKHYIYIEFFIIEEGKFFNSILQILEKKVKEGVEVKIIYDDMGCLGTLPVNYWKKLEEKGIEALAFNKFRPFLDVKQNNRDHRKMIIIDGCIVYSGGFNLADEYINEIERFGHWKDNGIRLYGQACYNFTLMFLSQWKLYKNQTLIIDKSKYLPSVYMAEHEGIPFNDGFVQPYGDLPYDKEAVGERVYLDIIHKAKKYVYIMTPYLIIDEEMQNALIEASKMSIDVRIILPHIPDKKAVFNVSRSNYGALLEAGVKIYEYLPGFVHSKTFLSDDLIATVGTFNLDYRSLYLHLENGTVLYQNRCLADIKRDFIDTFKVSKEISLQEWSRWQRRNSSYWKILKIISPFL